MTVDVDYFASGTSESEIKCQADLSRCEDLINHHQDAEKNVINNSHKQTPK
jgi:hypothetical protein